MTKDEGREAALKAARIELCVEDDENHVRVWLQSELDAVRAGESEYAVGYREVIIGLQEAMEIGGVRAVVERAATDPT